jgi:hypothetical protein
VVGRDGVAYPRGQAKQSNTYMINAQENLLISDKQTDMYLNSDPEKKAELTQHAWENASL